jgi:hypothetical protein
MFAELTRSDKPGVGQKQNTVEKTSTVKTEAAMIGHSAFMQAVYN